ncbi:ABC transporter ATP-binding protein/permease [Pseudoxanthomonas sp. JBR18]|uniref:ABC transporter ATP-binding protein/permease n=1 Tax=Pseudoxanthomonas sp. JBR18 TaxID=2969308 RepID=UPI002305485D|nr:ABC transporter ATP-binding protein/permease [Pseudoxanthomonas sp. JBR18]WCE06269.1 ABC transporter ATP-binding protein/permease [Pseudoxanthomonas sp. JBR18]
MNAHNRPRLRELILPYWTSRESWRGWILLAIRLVLMFTSVYVAVWANRLSGEVVDALVKREWGEIWRSLGLSWVAGMFAMLVSMVLLFAVEQLQQYEWRTAMTRWLLRAWTRRRTYYAIERDGCLDNADQRISQDVPRFIELTLQLFLNPIQVVVTAASFTVVLWHLSGTLRFTLWGIDFAIPGYMVYLVYAYSAGSLLISHFTGRPLIYLFNRRQTVEANFRYRGMQLRENAEQIAFYDGGVQERKRLEDAFEEVRANWRDIIVRNVKLILARETYTHTLSTQFLPTAAAMPRYLSGAITLGDVTRVGGAFTGVSGNLAYFSQAYVTFTEWWALGNRLRDLLGSIREVNDRPSGIHVAKTSGTAIETHGLSLRKPGGESLASFDQLRLRRGERWLVRGTSGTGKSTLLRAVAGIWPYGEGEIDHPRGDRLMFLPQRSYIPQGTLKAALCYPGQPEDFNDRRVRKALHEVQLPALADRLHDSDRWQQKLSGGEQQRLAICRALLQRPDYLFLDEATSALDPDTEQALYQALLHALPDSTLISVAHRQSLASYHDHVLDLSGKDGA